MTLPTDFRDRFFGHLNWWTRLEEPPQPGVPSAWFLLKGPEPEWYVQTLNSALRFAVDHSLEAVYREHFATITLQDLSPARAAAENRSVTSPIWRFAGELLVASVLERVAGWTYLRHEPPGRRGKKGDWEFRSTGNRTVFVEVKTFDEPEQGDVRAHVRPDYRPRVRAEVREAYSQLPDDNRATLLVLVGREIPRISFGIMQGSIFEALFGRYQVRMAITRPEPTLTYEGPSFYDMLMHGAKHRRLGCVAGLALSGLESPNLSFYAIDNPYAHPQFRIASQDWRDVPHFAVDDAGLGTVRPGLSNEALWSRLSDPAPDWWTPT